MVLCADANLSDRRAIAARLHHSMAFAREEVRPFGICFPFILSRQDLLGLVMIMLAVGQYFMLGFAQS